MSKNKINKKNTEETAEIHDLLRLGEGSKRSLLLSLLAVMTVVGPGSVCQAQNPSGVPRIVVSVLIDQLRSDYLEAFMPLYGNDGFRRLLTEGRVYPQAEYPMNRPDLASAAASFASGSAPSSHGIVGRKWLDRETVRPVFCLTDNSCTGLGGTDDKFSPVNLAVSTIGDELKVATEGKAQVFSLGGDAEGAIYMAGHAADGALWIDGESGRWCTTSYYGTVPSWMAVRSEYVGLDKTIDDTVWKPSSDLVGNFSYFLTGGMKRPFSHKFKGDNKYRDFKTCGLVNGEIAKAAKGCIEATTIGADATTDYLSITLYAGTFGHKPAGEVAMELQDTYVRLDKAMADIIAAVDKKVGKGNALYVVTSSGYVDEQSADLSKYRIPTGTFDMKRAAALLNLYLAAVYGQGQYVEASFGTQLYIDHKLVEEKQINMGELLDRSQDLLLQLSGVKDVFTSQRLLQGAWTPGISRIRAGYYPRFSGDITIQVASGWHYVNNDNREEQLVRESYIPYPIIFYGFNVESRKIDTPVGVERIAPTLSKAMRIRAPNACGEAPLF